ASSIGYPSATDYLPITAGTYDVDVRPAGSMDVLLHIAGWSIAPGAQASVIIIDGADGKLDVVPLVDAAAASTMPAGGVQTGYGGMAPEGRSSTGWTTGAVAALAVVAAMGLLATRTRRRAVSR